MMVLLEKRMEGYKSVSPAAILKYEITEDYNTELEVSEFGIKSTMICDGNKIISYSVKSITPNRIDAEDLMRYLFDRSICPDSILYVIEDILLC